MMAMWPPRALELRRHTLTFTSASLPQVPGTASFRRMFGNAY